MVVVLFRNKPRPDGNNADYGKLGARLVGIVSAMAGYISVETFTNTDGESLVLATFESEDAVKAWREQEDHRSAQGRREDFYNQYSVQICEVVREYSWQRNEG